MSYIVKTMTPRFIDCGICGNTVNHDDVKDRLCVPMSNGSPTKSTNECDG